MCVTRRFTESFAISIGACPASSSPTTREREQENRCAGNMAGVFLRRLAAGVAATAAVGEVVSAGRAPGRVVEWAHPHPYGDDSDDADDDSQRFVPMQRYKRKLEAWDLHGLVKKWKESDGEETWPWVWTWHNPNGPHFVYVGVDAHTLEYARLAAAASPQNNLTLVVSSMQDIEEAGLSAADFHLQRCAIIESRPAQIDFDHKILMLEDERIICYDSLNLTS